MNVRKTKNRKIEKFVKNLKVLRITGSGNNTCVFLSLDSQNRPKYTRNRLEILNFKQIFGFLDFWIFCFADIHYEVRSPPYGFPKRSL